MTSRSDRVCVHGCMGAGQHYAGCPGYGVGGDSSCSGCVPEPARDRALICDRCYRRLRGLLRNAPDLVGRLRTIGDPAKAAVYDQVRVSSATNSGEEEADRRLEAVRDVQQTLRSWAVYLTGAVLARPAAEPEDAFDAAADHVRIILGDFDRLVNDHARLEELEEGVTARHLPDAHGARAFWSILDAMSKWGPERREQPTVGMSSAPRELRPTPVYDESTVSEIPEWGERRDEVIGRAEAEVIAGSESTLRRWVADEGVTFSEFWSAGRRVRLYRRSQLVATKARLARSRAENLVQNRAAKPETRDNDSSTV